VRRGVEEGIERRVVILPSFQHAEAFKSTNLLGHPIPSSRKALELCMKLMIYVVVFVIVVVVVVVDYEHDEFSSGDPLNSICARGDLSDPPEDMVSSSGSRSSSYSNNDDDYISTYNSGNGSSSRSRSCSSSSNLPTSNPWLSSSSSSHPPPYYHTGMLRHQGESHQSFTINTAMQRKKPDAYFFLPVVVVVGDGGVCVCVLFCFPLFLFFFFFVVVSGDESRLVFKDAGVCDQWSNHSGTAGKEKELGERQGGGAGWHDVK